MRHETEANTPSPDPSQVAVSDSTDMIEERMYVRVGPPDAAWSHAKWLALADQALQE